METISTGITADKFLEKISRNFIGSCNLSKTSTSGTLVTSINSGFTTLDSIASVTSTPITIGMSGSQFRSTLNSNFTGLYSDNTTLDKRKLQYVSNGLGGLICFGIPTFTEAELEVYSSVDLVTAQSIDVDQWLDAVESAGMKYAILVTMHHDGFKLWDSQYSDYNITATDWYINHNGYDIVERFVDGCRSRGLYCGLYMSIWDRSVNILDTPNDPGKTNCINYTKACITELLTNYGTIDAIWFDGWEWALNGYTLVPYATIHDHVMSLQPNIIFYDNNHNHPASGSDIEGYESGEAGDIPSNNTPERLSESNMSILTTHWFWHSGHTNTPKTAALMRTEILAANSRYGVKLYGICPDNTGLVPQAQLDVLAELGTLME